MIDFINSTYSEDRIDFPCQIITDLHLFMEVVKECEMLYYPTLLKKREAEKDFKSGKITREEIKRRRGELIKMSRVISKAYMYGLRR